jgi:hypothetical protein
LDRKDGTGLESGDQQNKQLAAGEKTPKTLRKTRHFRRLQSELTLQSKVQGTKSQGEREAEDYLSKAIAIGERVRSSVEGRKCLFLASLCLSRYSWSLAAEKSFDICSQI